MEIKGNIAIEFDEFSKNYTTDMIGCVPHYLRLVESFIKYLPENFSPTSILDLGCGNGNITEKLIQLFPTTTFTLVDASREMINLCKYRFDFYNLKYHNNYFTDFKFQEKSYDLILAGFSLHHLDDKNKHTIFKKIFDSLKHGGIFSYSDLMISKSNSDHSILLKQWEKFVNTSFPDGAKWNWIMDHYKTFDNPTDYTLQIEWMKNAGFKNIEIPFKKGYWIYLQAFK
jgi:ubiquinone/menaquinone biosynthesis C-methylase UbiE